MGLAQNGMKAKPALPARVRSMEGLGRNAPAAEKNIFGQALRGGNTVQS